MVVSTVTEEDTRPPSTIVTAMTAETTIIAAPANPTADHNHDTDRLRVGVIGGLTSTSRTPINRRILHSRLHLHLHHSISISISSLGIRWTTPFASGMTSRSDSTRRLRLVSWMLKVGVVDAIWG